MTLPSKVTIVEVGPRDGLQNESELIPTDIKIDFIHRLSKTGLTVIEATSFVSPKWMPQMADHTEVLQAIMKDTPSVRYPVLVPNDKGLKDAMAAGAKDIAVFTAASDTFSKKNTNASMDESLRNIEKIMKDATKYDLRVRGYVSCVMGCPYEGDVDLNTVADVAKKLHQMGCYEVSLGDTIGVGTPQQAKRLINAVAKYIPIDNIGIHFHDTRGQALVNIVSCLELGVSTIDSSIGGLGGCPYANGATGNVATEDLLYLLNGLGIETGVDLQQLIDIDHYIHSYLPHNTRSKVAVAVAKKY